jgi:hypothetical protein
MTLPVVDAGGWALICDLTSRWQATTALSPLRVMSMSPVTAPRTTGIVAVNAFAARAAARLTIIDPPARRGDPGHQKQQPQPPAGL